MPLRNPLIILPYAIPYYILKVIKMDTPFMVAYVVPRLITSIQAALSDYLVILISSFYI